MSLQEKLMPLHCIICQEERRDGLELFGKFICTMCEQEIVDTSVADPKYLYFLSRLKALFANG
jgi:hypothetical protein